MSSLCIKCSQPTKKFYKDSNSNEGVYLCDSCYNSQETTCREWSKYRNSIEDLRKEFGKLMKLSDIATTTNKNKIGLKTRKQSIALRNLLFEFRQISLEHEKFIKSQTSK